MATILSKLRIGARLDLATIPELSAWAPPRLKILPRGSDDDGRDAWVSEEGAAVDPREVARVWREIGAGQWCALASIDIGTECHVAMRYSSARAVEWSRLRRRELDVLGLVARGYAQKVIAIKLGMAPSTVSANLQSARGRLGFPSFAQLVRAYCAAREAIEENDERPRRLAP
jgi:DNA-binding CsgD family transcriptional regulator